MTYSHQSERILSCFLGLVSTATVHGELVSGSSDVQSFSNLIWLPYIRRSHIAGPGMLYSASGIGALVDGWSSVFDNLLVDAGLSGVAFVGQVGK